MIQWLNDILNLFFPAECHLCGGTLASHEKFICKVCEENLPRTRYHRKPGNPIEERFAGHFPFVAATGHFFYNRDSTLSQLIQDMKYRKFPSIGNKLGEIAGKELYTSGFLNEVEILVPVPMHYLKKARRGYNQTENICQGLASTTGLEVIDALKMIKRRKTQTSLSQSERLSNSENLFAVKKDIDLNNKTVMLVDDICTTGATLDSAAQTLTKAFPMMRLYLFTLGVTF